MMNNLMEDVLLHQYVKIALAVAIIRRKPKGMMAKTYIDEILSKRVLLDGNRNKQAVECHKLMADKQQDLISIILSKTDTEIGVESSSTQSREESSSSTLLINERCLHVLKQVPLQCCGREKPVLFLKEDSSILKNTLRGALEFLTKITQPSKAMLPVPKQMYQAVIHKLKAMPFTTDDVSEFKPLIGQMLDNLIKCLLHRRNTFPSLDSQDITDIALSVGTSVFRDVCLLRLSWHVQEFAILLKPVAKGEEDLGCKVEKYNKVCYVLLALEQILVELCPENACPETVNSIYCQLNDALLQISQAFPVFAHFLWRLQVLLLQLLSVSDTEKQHTGTC